MQYQQVMELLKQNAPYVYDMVIARRKYETTKNNLPTEVIAKPPEKSTFENEIDEFEKWMKEEEIKKATAP